MDITTVLIALGLLIFFSHIFNALFSKTRIPNVLLLMLIGLLAGPVFHWITPEYLGGFGRVFTTLTLITILFESGTNLKFEDLKKSVLGASLLTSVNFVGSFVIGALVGSLLLQLDLLHSLFMGAALGGTSSAVVIPMINQLRPGAKTQTTLFLESALSDILCLIVSLALLGGIQTGEVSVSGIFSNMGFSMFFAILIGVVFGIVWVVVLKKWLRDMKNTMFTTFASAFILYGLAETMEMNGGICILAYGITVGNIGGARFLRKLFTENEESVLNQEERNFYSEIVFIMQTYFFVYIGVSIQLDNIWHLFIGGIFVVLVFLFRFLTSPLIGKKDTNQRDRKLTFALGPRGLVAAVLASLPLQNAQFNLMDAELSGDPLILEKAQALITAGEKIQNVSYATVLISIILCSILIYLFEAHNNKKELESVEVPVESDQPEPENIV